MFITVVRGDELISIQAAPDSYVQEILLKARQELCPYEHSIRVREVFHCDGRPLEARKPNFNSPVSPPILGLKAACRNYEREVVEQGPDLELELSVVGISGGVADAELFMGAKTTTRLGQVASFVANQLAPGQQGVHQVIRYI